MSRVVIVLPSIVHEFTAECLATLSPELIDTATIPGPPTGPQRSPLVCGVNGLRWTDGHPNLRLWVIYNDPTHNLGCAGSWNIGRQDVIDTDADWLCILSAATRFGAKGGVDWIDRLDDFADLRPDVLGLEAGDDMGWHLIAFPRHVLERVGPFDEVFSPAYFEDNDLSVRIQRAYDRDTKAPGFSGPLWPKVEIDCTLVEVAHSLKRSGVSVNMEGLRQKFIAKWGPDESYRTPYDDPTLDYTFTGEHA